MSAIPILFTKIHRALLQDCKIIGELIGQKILITEFPAFLSLADYAERGEISRRSFQIATYSLCGFANLPSIGIQILLYILYIYIYIYIIIFRYSDRGIWSHGARAEV